ncbi:PREDICTED: uncharacterized protein LOC109333011 [Lupinus angustifolius]|uniref:uncharacterized protein LOC109333011 n=1 Tax=Lupinus angustifolius TaxID=3871 RepID=UPI00092E4B69|nr:PREDICTED: uncharacterized protein LOC109333011 [Lupinus angustifolius]
MDSTPNLQRINSQVPILCSSFSYPSEPLDVGNWFSSYEYHSPTSDSNFSFQESASRERESERVEDEEAKFENIDELVVEENLVQCGNTCVENDKHKIVDSVSSLSVLSEPQDIGNWFSSYNYDSSMFDTNSILRDVVSEENECQEERFDVEVLNEDEGRPESENVPSKPNGCVEHNSPTDKNIREVQPSSRDDGSVEMKIRNLTTANTSHLGKILLPCVQDKILQLILSPTKYEELSSLTHGETSVMPYDTDRNLFNNMIPPKLTQKIEEEKSKAKVQLDKLGLNTDLAKSSSARNSTCTSNKENDGFVTARKNRNTRENGESSWKKPEKMSSQSSTNTGTVPLSCDRHKTKKRKALTEATNLQQSNVVEITGKWKCPRKGKADIGAPMKQLRIEQWVRRV